MRTDRIWGCRMLLLRQCRTVGEGGAMGTCGAKRFFAILAKLRMVKKLLLDQQLQLTITQIGTKNR